MFRRASRRILSTSTVLFAITSWLGCSSPVRDTDHAPTGVDVPRSSAPLDAATSKSTSSAAVPTAPTARAAPHRLAAGNTHACHIEPDGRVACWGSQGHGEASASARDAIDVALSVFYGCAVVRGGAVQCWGSDPGGATRPPALTDAIRIGASQRGACALRATGDVVCWGAPFGVGEPGATSPSFAPAVSGVHAIGLASYGYSAVLSTDDATFQWGRVPVVGPTTPREGCAALEGRGGILEPVSGPWPAPESDRWSRLIFECASPVRVDLPPSADVGVGSASACALDREGAVRCWGENDSGQLGDGTAQRSAQPRRVDALPPVTAIAVGGWHACAIAVDGEVYCWGSGESGQVGDGGARPRSKPVRVEGLHGATAIACGTAFTCAERGPSEVWCWGSNWKGQLGVGGDTEDHARPVRVTAGR